MRVDYVRVYQCNRDLDSGLGCDGLIDPVDPAIEPAAPDQVYVAEYDLYGDQAGPLAFPDVDAVVPLSISLYDNNGALSLSEVQAEDEHPGGHRSHYEWRRQTFPSMLLTSRVKTCSAWATRGTAGSLPGN